jgi:hypothetical protein
VAGLKTANRDIDVGIVDVGHTRVRIEIAGESQTLAQRNNARIARAEPQPVDLRHLRPAAARNDAFVVGDRLAGVLRGRGRQRRQRCLRHGNGARGGIEALAEITALGLVDQGLQQRILGLTERRRGAQRTARRCRARHEGAPAEAHGFVGMTEMRPYGHQVPDSRAVSA